MVNAFHIDLTVVYFVGKRGFQHDLYLRIADRTSFHSEQVVFFIDFAPVNDLAELDFENEAEPYPAASAVALSERVSNIHFDVFFNYFIKGALRHFVKRHRST